MPLEKGKGGVAVTRKTLDVNQVSCQRLKSWMRDNKISQKDLAEGIDYTPQYFHCVFSGKKRLTYDMALRIEAWSRQEPNTKAWHYSFLWWKPERYSDVCPVSRFWLLGGEDDELTNQIDELTKCVRELKTENELLKKKLGKITKICLEEVR